MTMSQSANFTLENVNDGSVLSTNTETMSGIEPLPSSSTPSPNYSPNPNIPLAAHSPRMDFERTRRFAEGAKFDVDLFSPVGDARNNPDVVADNAPTAEAYGKMVGSSLSETGPRRRDVTSSEPSTLRKEWSAMQRHSGFSESKHHHHYSGRNRQTSDHSTTESQTVTSRQLFVRKDIRELASSKTHSNQNDAHTKKLTTSDRSDSERQAFGVTSGLGDSHASSKLGGRETAQGATYRYNVQSDRIDIDQQSTDDGDSLPPHYYDGSFTEPLASGRSEAQQRMAPEGVGGHPSGFLSLSSQRHPTASNPQLKGSPQERGHANIFQVPLRSVQSYS